MIEANTKAQLVILPHGVHGARTAGLDHFSVRHLQVDAGMHLPHAGFGEILGLRHRKAPVGKAVHRLGKVQGSLRGHGQLTGSPAFHQGFGIAEGLRPL